MGRSARDGVNVKSVRKCEKEEKQRRRERQRFPFHNDSLLSSAFLPLWSDVHGVEMELHKRVLVLLIYAVSFRCGSGSREIAHN